MPAASAPRLDPAPPWPDWLDVSHETLARLEAYEDFVQIWGARLNLLSRRDLIQIRTRHILDSAQLPALAPQARNWLDLGSGAGFPGLVVAILLRHRPGAQVRLIERNRRKAAFLREAIRMTAAAAQVECAPAEQAAPAPPPDVITARALAPLPRLLALARPFFGPPTIALFHKGRGLSRELTQAQRDWRIRSERIKSRTDPKAVILKVRGLEPRVSA